MKQFTQLKASLCLSLCVFTAFASVNAPALTDHFNAPQPLNTESTVSFANNLPSPLVNYFPRPTGLNEAVNFWRQVFGEWQAHQIVLHDDEHLGIVYETIEISGYIGGRLSLEQQAKVDERKQHLIDQLNDINYRLHKRMGLTAEQTSIYKLVIHKAGRKALRDAVERVRVQRGMKESFQMGLTASNRYSAYMQKVFRDNQLPEQLAYIPHVESAFTSSARSPAGAVGVWQFMPVTGKRFLRMDNAIDERYDPILSTQGAAKYLAYAHDILGDWGLAITAYNYGLSGMSRARHEFGKDIAKIVKEYSSPTFGFASRNYYAEFLAVCDIMANLPHYFPEGVKFEEPPVLKYVELPKPMTSGEVAKKYHVHYTVLAEHNPAWTKEAAEGLVALPANTAVWIPVSSKKTDKLNLAFDHKLPMKNESGLGGRLLSWVNKYLTTWDVFAEFPTGLSGKLLASAKPEHKNQVVNETIKVAQAAKVERPKRLPSKSNDVHIVRSGDSPYTIATKYSVQLRELLSINDMDAGSLIRPGQPIIIPIKATGQKA